MYIIIIFKTFYRRAIFDESVSEFHAMAALCLKVILPISGFRSLMLMVVPRQ